MSRPRIVVVGDVVLDRDFIGSATRLSSDAPVPVVDVEVEASGPGGAGLTAELCLEENVDVTLIAPWASDRAGWHWRDAIEAEGVRVVPLGAQGPTREKIRVRAREHGVVRVDRGGPAAPLGDVPAAARAAISGADVVLVSCYGAGTTAHRQLRDLLAARARRGPIVWDPHMAGGPPVPMTTVCTPNLSEARHACDGVDPAAGATAVRLREQWGIDSVMVTVDGDGAWLATGGRPVHLRTDRVDGDSCGAGDRLAASLAGALAHGAAMHEAAATAVVEASRFVADGGASGHRCRSVRAAGSHALSPAGAAANGLAVVRREPEDVVADVRSHGGTLVAAGGCFDVLHAGHVSYLRRARALGDALVVLLNGDASVRRLKGPMRPVNPVAERQLVLEALSCVDAVVVFDDDTPAGALEWIRPDLWVKGSDYDGRALPEAQRLSLWGGRTVILPLVPDHSSTAVIDRLGLQRDGLAVATVPQALAGRRRR